MNIASEFFFYYIGFLWLYLFIFHKPTWICNRIRDIEKTLITVLTDLISISIVIIFFQTFKLILQTLSPILRNLVYPIGKLSSYLFEKTQNEMTHLSVLFEKTVIDFLIVTIDNAFFYPLNRIYIDLIEPEILIPILIPILISIFTWIEEKQRWFENKTLFIKHLKEFHKKIWQW